MRAGSYDIPLRLDAPWDLFETVLTIDEGVGGHIVITPQWLDAGVVGDTAMLAAARYTGPVLNKEFRDGEFTISGAGMVWWLGDEDDKGDIHETEVALSGATLTTAVNAALPPGGSITAGTIGSAEAAYTGNHIHQTPLQILRTIMNSAGAEFRVNPDGTLDADVNGNLFNLPSEGDAVIAARLISGSDPVYTGIPIATARSTRSARRYATRALLVDEQVDGSKTLRVGTDRGGVTGKDIHGNTIDRTTHVLSTHGDSSISAQQYTTTELNENNTVEEMELTTGYWELINGGFAVGDVFYVYDPPAIVDTSFNVWFRGDYIHPVELRLVAATWPLVDGMGVWFRDGDAAYTDLTDYVKWEVPFAQAVDTGATESALRGGRFTGTYGGTTLTVRSWVEQLPGG